MGTDGRERVLWVLVGNLLLKSRIWVLVMTGVGEKQGGHFGLSAECQRLAIRRGGTGHEDGIREEYEKGGRRYNGYVPRRRGWRPYMLPGRTPLFPIHQLLLEGSMVESLTYIEGGIVDHVIMDICYSFIEPCYQLPIRHLLR